MIRCGSARAGLLALLLLPALPAPGQTLLIDRGRQIVEGIAACGSCHTPEGELAHLALAGGQVFEEPGLYRAFAPNITPDLETGIGRWTDTQIARAIREGRRPDGAPIGPPMPVELYRGISDADLLAIVAYLRTVRPVRNQVGRSSYGFPLTDAPVAPVSRASFLANSSAARGAYLAGPLGHCIACHTPMRPDGRRDWARTGAGGPPITTPQGPVVPRNITPHPTAGIGAWTDEQIIQAITMGVSADGRPLSPPMAFAFYARMTEGELRDLVAYLRSLPPQP